VIIDELHRWRTSKSRELFDVLTKGTVARDEPIVFEITTSGSTEDESPIAWLEHERVRLLLDGHFSDPTFYGMVFGVDPKADWTDEEIWKLANPSLETNGGKRKGFLKLSALRAEFQAAMNQPSLQAAFKRYHLGIWMSTETEWMPREVWRANGGPLRALVERPCYLGLDLSETTDLTSLVCLFPDPEDGTYDVLAQFWMAEERVRERELADRVPYSTWARDKLLTLTDGNVIDLRDIKKHIEWASGVFDIRELAFDPHHALQLSIELTEEIGVKCVPVPQRYSHMSEPSKKLLELALQTKLRHGGNPVLGWNVDCVRMKGDGNDNIKPVKPVRYKEGKRIDGAVAMILAISRAMFHKGSVYDKRGLVTA
jgi:phage terminase large subunit-like protein